MTEVYKKSSIIIDRLNLIKNGFDNHDKIFWSGYKNITNELKDLNLIEVEKEAYVYYVSKIFDLIHEIKKTSSNWFSKIKSYEEWKVTEFKKETELENCTFEIIDFSLEQYPHKKEVDEKILSIWNSAINEELAYYISSLTFNENKNNLIEESNTFENPPFRINETQALKLFYLTISEFKKNIQFIKTKASSSDKDFFLALTNPKALSRNKESVKFYFDCELAIVAFIFYWLKKNDYSNNPFKTVSSLNIFFLKEGNKSPITLNGLSSAKSTAEKTYGFSFDEIIESKNISNSSNIHYESTVKDICIYLNTELRDIFKDTSD